MNTQEKNHFDTLYENHLKRMKLRGLSVSTIDAYSRAVRRLAEHFDCSPDRLSHTQLEDYFIQLIDSHSWSTVKLDRNGIQFFWKYVLKSDWTWLKMIKPPRVTTIPDILTPSQINQLITAATQNRYRVFLLTVYSMGLRLSEALNLHVGDIDGEMMQIHIRRGKGHVDRMVPLPAVTYRALQSLWQQHKNAHWLFPNARGNSDTIKHATTHMNKSGVQTALKAILKSCGIKKKSRCILFAIVMPHIYSSSASACGKFSSSLATKAR
jgi:integrase